MKVAILQSSYIPWRGYFDIIGSVDVFILYDDVQFRKNHWHNRNIIKTDQGLRWLTLPAGLPNGVDTSINDVSTKGEYCARHWRSIDHSYARAEYWSTEGAFLKGLFTEAQSLNRLSQINFLFIEAISRRLGFETRFQRSDGFEKGERTARLVSICQSLGAHSYLTGPAARTYLDIAKFDAAGIDVKWMDYSGYPEYPQLHGSFEPYVSIIDLLLNVGPRARDFMKAGTGL